MLFLEEQVSLQRGSLHCSPENPFFLYSCKYPFCVLLKVAFSKQDPYLEEVIPLVLVFCFADRVFDSSLLEQDIHQQVLPCAQLFVGIYRIATPEFSRLSAVDLLIITIHGR